jgi:hypothetical protein
LTVNYDPAAGTYSLSSLQTSFASADASIGQEPANFSYFEKQQTSLVVLKDSPSNSRIVLNYLSYGLWSKSVASVVSSDGTPSYTPWAGGAFLLGTETLASDMPRTGSVTYQGIVDNSDQSLLGSTGSLAANFATGTVTTTLSLRSNLPADLAPVTGRIGMLSGSGTIGAATSHFSGDLTGTLNGVDARGSFLGSFFGPNAAEAGYAFSANTPDPNSGYAVTGVFVGKR